MALRKSDVWKYVAPLLISVACAGGRGGSSEGQRLAGTSEKPGPGYKSEVPIYPHQLQQPDITPEPLPEPRYNPEVRYLTGFSTKIIHRCREGNLPYVEVEGVGVIVSPVDVRDVNKRIFVGCVDPLGELEGNFVNIDQDIMSVVLDQREQKVYVFERLKSG